jgi:hypothetical protein
MLRACGYRVDVVKNGIEPPPRSRQASRRSCARAARTSRRSPAVVSDPERQGGRVGNRISHPRCWSECMRSRRRRLTLLRRTRQGRPRSTAISSLADRRRLHRGAGSYAGRRNRRSADMGRRRCPQARGPDRLSRDPARSLAGPAAESRDGSRSAQSRLWSGRRWARHAGAAIPRRSIRASWSVKGGVGL